MNIPVIIVHRGNTFYLKPVLEHIRLFNPDTRICLISDVSTRGKYNFVEHYDWEDYSGSANNFALIYKHMSSNTYEFELGCFQRWFVVNDFVRRQGIEHFVCLDSDVLLFCQVDEVYRPYLNYDFTIGYLGLPHCSLFNHKSIEKVCDYMINLYTDENNLCRLKAFYQTFLDKNSLGGICDMTAFTWYQTDVSDNVIDITKPVNGCCFDTCIGVLGNFEYENGKKKVYWIDNLPYGKLKTDQSLIRFYCLHLQGRTKYSIFKYVLDKNKVHHSGFLYTLKWMLSKEILKARLKSIKKAIDNPQLVLNFLKAKLK